MSNNINHISSVVTHESIHAELNNRKRRTFKVLNEDFLADGGIDLICPGCGIEAEVPTRGHAESPVIASLGLNVIFENPSYVPPPNWMPKMIQCRYCRRIFSAT